MILIEFIVLLVTILVTWSSTILIMAHSRDVPVPEIKPLVLGLFLLSFNYVGGFITVFYYLQSGIQTNFIVNLIYRVGTFLTILGFLILSVAIYLPDFKYRYSSIFILGYLFSINVAAATANFYTNSASFAGNRVIIIFDPLALVLVLISVISLLAVFLKRVIEVSSIIGKDTRFSSFNPFVILGAIFTATIVIAFITVNFPELGLPAFGFCIPLAITYVYFFYAFKKNKAFLFITPARLEAVYIVNKETSIVLFSQSFVEQKTAESLVGGLLNALNYSLKTVVKSETDLQEISFGKKGLEIASGRWITGMILVTETNMITKAICRHIVKQFEQNFENALVEQAARAGIVRVMQFKAFEKDLAGIRKYIPL